MNSMENHVLPPFPPRACLWQKGENRNSISHQKLNRKLFDKAISLQTLEGRPLDASGI